MSWAFRAPLTGQVCTCHGPTCTTSFQCDFRGYQLWHSCFLTRGIQTWHVRFFMCCTGFAYCATARGVLCSRNMPISRLETQVVKPGTLNFQTVHKPLVQYVQATCTACTSHLYCVHLSLIECAPVTSPLCTCHGQCVQNQFPF